MATVYTTPGVYIEQLHNPSLSVGFSATAVPVFACDKEGLIKVKTRINSWLDVVKLLEASNENAKFDFSDNLQSSLKTYFENGGGYCWVIPTEELEDEVPKLDDVTLLVAAGEDIRTAVNALCQRGKTLFAILDGPDDEPTGHDGKTNSLPDEDEEHQYELNPYAAVYYPWLHADWAADRDTTTGKITKHHKIPPSAAVAGAYCTVDRERGVWKAPANVVLKGGVRPAALVTDAFQGRFNVCSKPINMIRTFRGMGTTIWGARTLENNDEWRYVPVRRLFNAAQRDIKKAMQAVMFEPNAQPTWVQVSKAIDSYLYKVWQRGGLHGNKAEEAYFVQVGLGLTMTEDDIRAGQMIVKIGLAAVRPAEFIILQFTQNMAQA
ncbi:phage tail sheath family protein [Burkholderia ubonensis]|uniref:phage tail sheath family protein n=1 Tax=Burkholderia ubonensis TaxID=101571 RepID=UPI00075F3FF2|nr:phage tail sheath C-terminal domain-containing protein [Burkholderia ubonensis]KWN65860.1 phage tail protein [Burkholderia ubonensis]